MESSRAVGALDSFTPPQEYIPMRKQVSRLCFILLGRLPAFKSSGFRVRSSASRLLG